MAEEELREEAGPSLRELQEARSDLAALIEHRGFKRLKNIVDIQIEGRKSDIIMKPLEEHDQVLHQEFSKGEVTGMIFVMNILQTTLEQLDHDIELKLKEEDHGNSSQT